MRQCPLTFAAFNAAGLPYFNPHSIRHMLVRHIMSLELPLQMLKSWSQNLGHEGLLTTLTSYGHVPFDRQAALIRQDCRLLGTRAHLTSMQSLLPM